MPEAYFAHGVVAHEARLVHMSFYAVDASALGVLPHCIVFLVDENRRVLCVAGYHEWISVNLTCEISVVEVLVGVEQRLLSDSFLHEVDELEQRVAEAVCVVAAGILDVYHRKQILLLRLALGKEVLKLRLLVNLWTVEMITAHLQTILASQLDISYISGVLVAAAFRTFNIYIGHL